MTNGYWERRREALLAQMERDEARLFERLAKLYASESSKLEREIASYYQRYGEGNVIQYRNLLATLPEEDRRLLIERIDEFARKHPQLAHLVPVRKSIYMLNELEGIQASIRMHQLEIGAIEQEEFDAHFERQAQRAANLAAEEMGFGKNFYPIDAPLIKATVGAAWASGKSYSESLWGNRERLASYLNDDFAKGVARGLAYDKMVKALCERFENVSARDAKRLVYTEGTFLLNESQAQVHEQDFQMYRLSCVNDGRVCEVCRGLQEEQGRNPVRFSERVPGVNFPPMHPWCRCTYTVEVADWDAWIDAYVAARGGDSVTEGGVSFAIPDDIHDVNTLSNYSDVVFGTRIDGKCEVDVDSLKQVMGAVERVKEDFPELSGSINAVMHHSEASFVKEGEWPESAISGVSKRRHDVILLGDVFSDMNRLDLEGFILGKKNSGRFSTGSIEGMIFHECGHIMCHAIADKYPKIWFGGAEVARDAVTRAYLKWCERHGVDTFRDGMRPDDFKARISEYAKKSDREAVAEAFASVMVYGAGGSFESYLIYEEIVGMLRL